VAAPLFVAPAVRRLRAVSGLWAVSTGREDDRLAVYYDGRLVVDGYERVSEAWWAVSFLARGRHPAYVPEGVEIEWPFHGRER
jgi:hypothetical protein